eukprot:GHVS01069721.1.p1 GENE.GHVS01069721.1~~GHVS01069721.1.p1  ORF type:complete len:395 (+),score=76.49 GHVS01069721.1:750-1934(+)
MLPITTTTKEQQLQQQQQVLSTSPAQQLQPPQQQTSPICSFTPQSPPTSALLLSPLGLLSAEPCCSDQQFIARLTNTELSILDVIIKIYGGGGMAQSSRRTVNWEVISQALNSAMVCSGGYQARTARQLEELYTAHRDFTAHDSSLSLSMQYKPKVYGYAPSVSAGMQFPVKPFQHPLANATKAFARLSIIDGLPPTVDIPTTTTPTLSSMYTNAPTTSAVSGKGSMLRVIRGLCDSTDRNLSALSLLMTKSTKHNILLDQTESRSLKHLCNLVCGYGNVMRKQMAAHQNLYETFHVRELLSPDTDNQTLGAQIPVHASHAKVALLAANFLQHSLPSVDKEDDTTPDGPGGLRASSNCMMQVALAEVTRDRLKQLPSVLNPYPRPRKPQLPQTN